MDSRGQGESFFFFFLFKILTSRNAQSPLLGIRLLRGPSLSLPLKPKKKTKKRSKQWHIGPAASYLSERCRCVVVAPNYSTYSAREGLGISASVEDAVDAVRWAGTAATYAGGGEEAAAVGEAAEAKRGSPPPPPRPSPPSPPPRPPRSPPPSSRGGDPTRLAVLGHSAGAHLAVSAALVLAAERAEDGGRGGGGGSPEREPSGGGAPGPRGSHSLPSLVVSLAGPFDLPSHFEHEAKRGVHRLSTMARAAATPGSFALEAAKGGAGEGGGERGRREEPGPRPAAPFFAAAPELHRAALVALSPLACVSPEASLAGLRPAAGPLAGVAAAAAARRARGPERQRGGPRRRGAEGLQENAGTRFLFLSSDADLVVPPSSSAALSAALARGHGGRACSARHVQYSTGGATAAAAGRGGGGEGGRARVRVAGPVGHADFVVRGWGGSGSVPAAPWAAEVEAVVSSL